MGQNRWVFEWVTPLNPKFFVPVPLKNFGLPPPLNNVTSKTVDKVIIFLNLWINGTIFNLSYQQVLFTKASYVWQIYSQPLIVNSSYDCKIVSASILFVDLRVVDIILPWCQFVYSMTHHTLCLGMILSLVNGNILYLQQIQKITYF